MSERGTNDRERWFRAPGRVNLIGDHTDYNEGFVLPVAIDLSCIVRATPNDDGVVRLRSESVDDEIELAADGGARSTCRRCGPATPPASSGRSPSEAGRRRDGCRHHLDDPARRGPLFSAALEVARARALAGSRSSSRSPVRKGRCATGVPCGIMDRSPRSRVATTTRS